MKYAILVSWFTCDPRFTFVAPVPRTTRATHSSRASHVISPVSVLACEQASGGRDNNRGAGVSFASFRARLEPVRRLVIVYEWSCSK